MSRQDAGLALYLTLVHNIPSNDWNFITDGDLETESALTLITAAVNCPFPGAINVSGFHV